MLYSAISAAVWAHTAVGCATEDDVWANTAVAGWVISAGDCPVWANRTVAGLANCWSAGFSAGAEMGCAGIIAGSALFTVVAVLVWTVEASTGAVWTAGVDVDAFEAWFLFFSCLDVHSISRS